MSTSERLTRHGITLPPVATPIGSYRPAVRDGDHIHTSGQLPLRDGQLIATGLVGDQVDLDIAAEAARLCALNALAAAAQVAGGVDRLRQVVKVTGFVASAPGFAAQPKVLNGASDLLGELFPDEAGHHARSAVGVAALPLGAPVEVEVVFRVH